MTLDGTLQSNEGESIVSPGLSIYTTGMGFTSLNEDSFVFMYDKSKAPTTFGGMFAPQVKHNKLDEVTKAKFAYADNYEAKKGRELKITFQDVVGDDIPEEYYKGIKQINADGDRFEYENFVTVKIVPEAYEFLFDASNFFTHFKAVGSPDEKAMKRW